MRKYIVAVALATLMMGFASASPAQAQSLGDQKVITDPFDSQRTWHCTVVGYVIDSELGLGLLLSCKPRTGACMKDRAIIKMFEDDDVIITDVAFLGDQSCGIFGEVAATARANGLAGGLAARADQEGWMSATPAPAVTARTNGTAPSLARHSNSPATAVPWPTFNLTPTQHRYLLEVARFEPGNTAVESKSAMLATGKSHTNVDSAYWQRVQLKLHIPRLDPPGPRTLRIDWGDGVTATQTFDTYQQNDGGISIEHWYPDPYQAENDPCGVGPVWVDRTVKIEDTGANQGSHYMHVQYPTNPRPDGVNGGVWDC